MSYYLLSIENYHDATSKAESKAYYLHNELLSAQIQFSQKMASGINDATTKELFNLVVASDGQIQDDYKDHIEKYDADDAKVYKHYLFVLFTYEGNKADEILWNGYNDFDSALSNYYSKRATGMGKSDISTVTEIIVNSNCETEKSYFWDKNATPSEEV